jgi:hypothetical protein
MPRPKATTSSHAKLPSLAAEFLLKRTGGLQEKRPSERHGDGKHCQTGFESAKFWHSKGGHRFRTPHHASDPEDRQWQGGPGEDRVLRRRPPARSRLCCSLAALEASRPIRSRGMGLLEPSDLPAVLCQRNPEGLSTTRWREDWPSEERSTRPFGLAYVSAYVSLSAGCDRSTDRVQQKLMRHAQVATTMDVYGNALMESKRDANSKVVALLLRPSGDSQSLQL